MRSFLEIDCSQVKCFWRKTWNCPHWSSIAVQQKSVPSISDHLPCVCGGRISNPKSPKFQVTQTFCVTLPEITSRSGTTAKWKKSLLKLFLKKNIFFQKNSFLGIFRYWFQPGAPILLTLTIAKMSQNHPNLEVHPTSQSHHAWLRGF